MADYLTGLNSVSILLRLALATVCGGVIGVERGLKRRPAGLRTHILVCLGSALVMIVNQYITILYPGSDPARLGAQVISGIGFVCAGTIIVGKKHVTGLTTAAGLWASACMGLAAGIGFYEGAVIACLFIYVVMTLLHKLDERMAARSPTVIVYVGIVPGGSFTRLMEQMKDYGWPVTSLELVQQEQGSKAGAGAILTIETGSNMNHSLVIEKISSNPEIAFVDEL